MSGLESLFNGDGRLPVKIAEKLPFSLGYKREFEYIFGGKLPEFPRPPESRNGKKWTAKIPFYWILNFNRMIEFSWSSFLNFVDLKNRELDDIEHIIKKEFGNTARSRIELTREQLRILDGDIEDTKNNIKERSQGYDYILKEAENLSERLVKSENQEIMNLALATFGTYISDLFNKKMLQVFDQGSTKGKLYWKDCIFRSHVMKDILGEFFKKIEGNMKGYVKECGTFLNPDIALIENRFDTRKLTNYVLYGEIMDFSDYKKIKTEIINCVESPYKGAFSKEEQEFMIGFTKEIFERVNKGEILYEKALEALAHDPQIVAIALRSPTVLNLIKSRGVERLDDNKRRYKEFTEKIKKRDFLASFVFDLIDYSSFVDKPNIPRKDRKEILELEDTLYSERKLFDFTGKRSILLSEIPGAVWYFDIVNSRKIKKKLNNFNKILQELFLKTGDGSDKSIAKEIISEYSGEEYIPSRADDRGFVFPKEYFVLSAIGDFYKIFEEERKPAYVRTYHIPEMKEFGFRSGLSIGYANIDAKAKHLNARPAERSTDLADSEMYVKIGELEEKIKNEGRILFSVDPKNKEENVMDKLRQGFLTIQEYISNKKISELRGKMPIRLLEKIEKRIKENPSINMVLKNCEDLVKEKKPIENKNMLDSYVYKDMLDTYKEEIVPYKNELAGVIRHYCNRYNAYQSDFFGERPVIAYVGDFAGVGGERKAAEAGFGVYAFLPTDKQFYNFVSKLKIKCYDDLKKKGKEIKNEKK